MDKLYLVRHTDIALKSIQRGFTDDTDVFENHTNFKVFKKREKTEKYIIEWYNKWSELGTVVNGGTRINGKKEFNGSSAKVEYCLFGLKPTQVVEIYTLEEIDYNEQRTARKARNASGRYGCIEQDYRPAYR